MQVFLDPGRSTEPRGQTVSEVRVELAARGDPTTGSIVYVGERLDGTLVVTVARGVAALERRGPRHVAILVVEATAEAAAGDAFVAATTAKAAGDA